MKSSFTLKDITALVILIGLWSLMNFIINRIITTTTVYTYSLFLLVLFCSFSVFLIRKTGIATLFYGISSVVTMNTNGIGATGADKVISLLLIGIIFDIVPLCCKKSNKISAKQIITAASISSALLPIVMALRLSLGTALHLLTSTFNIILLSLLVGLAAGLCAYLVWSYLRVRKFCLRFELAD